MLLLTEKDADQVPTCEYGYWGGFSPKRQGGKYTDQHLTVKHSDGRARIYPARKMPKDTNLSSSQPLNVIKTKTALTQGFDLRGTSQISSSYM